MFEMETSKIKTRGITTLATYTVMDNDASAKTTYQILKNRMLFQGECM
jgi:hypothetical protein